MTKYTIGRVNRLHSGQHEQINYAITYGDKTHFHRRGDTVTDVA